MFENVSLNDLLTLITTAAAVVGAVATLCHYIKKATTKVVKEVVTEEIGEMKDTIDNNHQEYLERNNELHSKMDNLKVEIRTNRMDNAKNYIVPFLSALDEGRKPAQSEFEAFYDNLTIYESYDGNGFIHAWIDRLTAEKKFDSRQRETLRFRDTKPEGHS